MPVEALAERDQLFGVLCGLDKTAAVYAAHHDSPHLMTAARILSTILRDQLENEELLRRAERAETDALVDEHAQLTPQNRLAGCRSRAA